MSMRMGASISTPYLPRAARHVPYALATIVLVGMQPVLTQVPPKLVPFDDGHLMTGVRRVELPGAVRIVRCRL